MSLTTEIEAVGQKYNADIKAAEREEKKQKKAVDTAIKEYERSQNDLYTVQKAQYDARIAVVQKHIDKEIMTMKPKSTYSQKRVDELRDILAKTKDAKYQSYEKRFEILKALRELQLIVTTHPFVQRVSNIITKWTGKCLFHASDDRTEFYPFCWELKNGKCNVMKLYDRFEEREFPWLASWPVHQHTSLLYLNLENNRSGLRGLGAIHDFWEIDCARLKIKPEFLIQGEPSKPLNYGEKPENSDTFWENCIQGADTMSYVDDVNRIGWQAAVINTHQSAEIMTDENFASIIIADNPSIFTVKEVMSSYKHLTEEPDSAFNCLHCQSIVNNCIQDNINRLLVANRKGISDVRFDYMKRKLTWKRTKDGKKLELDVSRVKLAKVADYAFKHIKGLTPHGK